MKLKQENSDKKLRGAYYTPYKLAENMVRLINPEHVQTILEPSCGNGVFLECFKQMKEWEEKQITAIELNQDEVVRLENLYQKRENMCIINKDFFDFYSGSLKEEKKRYDLIIGNPPYIRYQYLEPSQRVRMSEILSSHGMKENKLVNAWVGFLVACVQLLRENGKIIFVIPAEILQVAYAEDLRLFLANQLSKITLFTFEKLVFPDIEQEVLVFLGEKGGEEKGIRIFQYNDLENLKQIDLEENGFQKLQHVHEKWTKYFTTVEENKLIQKVREDQRFCLFSELALINVGITTGNNKYFSVNKDIVKKYNLLSVTKPLIGRSSHADGIYFKEEDWHKNIDQGKDAYLLHFPDIPYKEYPRKHRNYIKEGEEKKEHTGYKCSIRTRWYLVPSVWIPDAFFLRRNNFYPKFVLNQCKAVSTDTMHRIKFNHGVKKEYALLSYYNSVSFAFTEICGRSYGGGVLEILPKEVGNIVLPKIDFVEEEIVKQLLEQVDDIVRENKDIEQALDLVDNQILVRQLHIEEETCKCFRKIWRKLQGRRMKRSDTSKQYKKTII